MKLLLLNASANTGSTGRIAEEIGRLAKLSGYEVWMGYGRQSVNSELNGIQIGTDVDFKIHALESRLFDNHGFSSRKTTQQFISEIEKIKPDIINIHNLHGYYIHVGILFEYLKRVQIPVVWTFHDCWPFTGHCSYFDRYDCRKWETECHHCPNRKGYPESWFFDRSNRNFHLKSMIFNGLENLSIVTPSAWLAQHVSRSFLKDYPVKVINNGVDLKVFHPQINPEIFAKYSIENKPFVLGVASIWDRRKGSDDFIALSKSLACDIQIVLVGLSTQQAAQLPKGIVSIARTENIKELAALYSAAAVFVNPTYVDNFPTTNIEALACGTPVITYRTGGSPEAIDAETGIVVEKGDVDGLKEAIVRVVNNGKEYYRDKCRERALRHYDKEERYRDYIDLFNHHLLIN